jgi:hypothetical protein
MFSAAVLSSVHSSDEAISKPFHILGRVIQNLTLTQRPRLGRNHLSGNTVNQNNLHTCHYISFREIYAHVLNTIITQDSAKSDSKEIQKRLTQYFSTILRGRGQNCSKAIIFAIYLIYTFDKYYVDKDRLPLLHVWVENKKIQESFKRFWFEVYNHPGNFSKNGHPRTNLMIRSRRDLVYTNGSICDYVHTKLASKWNGQLKALKKGQNPSIYNLPVIPNDFIGTKYTGVFDSSGKEQMDPEKLTEMLENGWFVLSSHAATTPRYRLPLSDLHKNYPEEFDAYYYSRDNDNFDVKVSSRVGEIELHHDNMTDDDKVIFKSSIKEILTKEKDWPGGKQNFGAIDVNDLPLNTDIEEPMPPLNPEQSFVYAGYLVSKTGIKGLKSPGASTSLSFGFGQ